LKAILARLYESGDFEAHYLSSRESENQSREALIEFQTQYPEALKNDSDVSEFLEKVREKRAEKFDTTPR
jgi:hypothetical protein